jgi:hypothetical protein
MSDEFKKCIVDLLGGVSAKVSVSLFPLFFFQVIQYLLDKALVIDEDSLYELSLKIEPRLPA